MLIVSFLRAVSHGINCLKFTGINFEGSENLLVSSTHDSCIRLSDRMTLFLLFLQNGFITLTRKVDFLFVVSEGTGIHSTTWINIRQQLEDQSS